MVSSSWKYLSIGLLAVLAVGFSFPQASAHITSSTQHMLQHIFNFVDTLEGSMTTLQDTADDIKEKTDNLASQDSVDDLTPQAIAISNLDVDPTEGNSQTVVLTEALSGNLLYGWVNLQVSDFGDNDFILVCETRGNPITPLGPENPVPSDSLFVREGFVCEKIFIQVIDDAGDEDAQVRIDGAIEFVEVTNVTELP